MLAPGHGPVNSLSANCRQFLMHCASKLSDNLTHFGFRLRDGQVGLVFAEDSFPPEFILCF